MVFSEHACTHHLRILKSSRYIRLWKQMLRTLVLELDQRTMCACSFNSTTEKGVTIVQGLKREYGQTKILKDLKKGIRLYCYCSPRS